MEYKANYQDYSSNVLESVYISYSTILNEMVSNHKYYYWYYTIKNNHLLFNLGTAAFVWSFLFIAKPFGIGDSNVSLVVLSIYLLLFALTWVFISYSTDFFTRIIVNTRAEENEKRSLIIFLIKNFLLVHSILIIRLALCNWSCIDLLEYAEVWLATIFSIGLSYLIYTFHAKYRYFKNMVGKGFDAELVVINSTGKYQFKEYPEKIVYFKSEDNYVRIVYLDEKERLKSDLIRLTLVSVENQIKSFSQFTRIHRSYMVNLNFLKHNSVGEFVDVLTGSDFLQLPVSRTYKKALVEKIT